MGTGKWGKVWRIELHVPPTKDSEEYAPRILEQYELVKVLLLMNYESRDCID